MSRRRFRAEQDFGSDSFLDIIANIVGILIILIIVAGMKVSRQASQTDVAAGANLPQSVVATVEEKPPANMPPSKSELKQQALAAERQLRQLQEIEEQIRLLSIDLAGADRLTSELNKQFAQLQDVQKNGIPVDDSADVAETEAQRRSIEKEIARLQSELKEVQQTAGQYRTTLASQVRRQKYVSTALRQIGRETRALQEVLADAAEDASETQLINHRLSPVGRPVVDAELHFRLKEGRIAFIPLEALLDRMRQQILSRRGLVLRLNRYDGVVGPVEGFRLQYTVERQASATAGLINGVPATRVAISGWKIIPAETLRAERVSEALKLGSRFRQVIESAEPDTTVTIWLYPKDFSSFGPLRELAHNLNLRVAARPLPEGTEIAGSPNGSRSTSQ